jgi:Zn-dependent protease with chaperone function
MVHKTPGRNRRAMWIAAILVSVAPASPAQDDSPLESALLYFTRHDAGKGLELFDSVRPAPVSDAERERILATLPREGDVRHLNPAREKKVAAVRRVLEPHRREAVYVIKVVQVPQAAVALHARAVVLVSERALDVLDAEELQALVAHEVGHEYFWDEYFRARRDKSQSSLRRLELLCDGWAVITLERVGLNPKRLTSALEKIVRYNRDRFGVALNEGDYPAVSERRKFVGRLVEWLEASGAR